MENQQRAEEYPAVRLPYKPGEGEQEQRSDVVDQHLEEVRSSCIVELSQVRCTRATIHHPRQSNETKGYYRDSQGADIEPTRSYCIAFYPTYKVSVGGGQEYVYRPRATSTWKIVCACSCILHRPCYSSKHRFFRRIGAVPETRLNANIPPSRSDSTVRAESHSLQQAILPCHYGILRTMRD